MSRKCSPHRSRAVPLVVLSLGAALCASGCVERRYTIRTIPPGALVVSNGEEIGISPASRSHVYYGERDITLYKDGYKTRRIIEKMDAPWWDNRLTEFFTENLVPFTLRDDREYIYKLEPEVPTDEPKLLQDAESLRARAQLPPKPRSTGILAWLGL
jgi:hypothetical protein